MLLVNLIGPGVLLAGLLYLEGYEAELIESEIGVMKAQVTLVAEALGESASREPDAKRDFEVALDEELAKRLVYRFASPEGARVRLFLPGAALLVDSRRVVGAGGLIQIENLPPPDQASGVERGFNRIYDSLSPIWERFIRRRPLYRERPDQTAIDYPEAVTRPGRGDRWRRPPLARWQATPQRCSANAPLQEGDRRRSAVTRRRTGNSRCTRHTLRYLASVCRRHVCVVSSDAIFGRRDLPPPARSGERRRPCAGTFGAGSGHP